MIKVKITNRVKGVSFIQDAESLTSVGEIPLVLMPLSDCEIVEIPDPEVDKKTARQRIKQMDLTKVKDPLVAEILEKLLVGLGL